MSALQPAADSAALAVIREWRTTLVALVLVVLAVIVAYAETFGAMVAIWARSETFAHGFIVPCITAWLLWRQRDRLRILSPLPAPRVALLSLLVGSAWLVGELASANALSQSAATLILILSVVTVLGPRFCLCIAFPLGFLLFAVPVGEFAIPRLMDWTADFAVLGLRLSGIPVYREGLSFVIPSGSWSVVEACSGVRYLLASVMVGTLFAYLNFRSPWRRLAFILVSILVPVVANWARAYLIVMLGHLSGNRLAVGVDHLIYGWVFFGVVILLMFWIGARWAERAEPEGPLPPPETPWASHWTAARLRGAAVAALLAAALPVVLLAAIERGERASAPVTLAFPEGDWAGWKPAAAPAAFVPAYQKSSASSRLHFSRGDTEVDVFVAYYRNQDHGNKMASSTNAVLRADDPDWTIARRGHTEQNIEGAPVFIPTLELAPKAGAGRSERSHLQVWRWYWVAGQLCGGDAEARMRTVWSRLRGQGDDSAVIVVAAEVPPGQDASAALGAFVRDAAPRLRAALERARGQR